MLEASCGKQLACVTTRKPKSTNAYELKGWSVRSKIERRRRLRTSKSSRSGPRLMPIHEGDGRGKRKRGTTGRCLSGFQDISMGVRWGHLGVLRELRLWSCGALGCTIWQRERDYCSTRQTRITTHNETCLSSQHKSEYGSCKVVLRVELYTDEMLARNGSTIDSKNNSKHLARPDFES